MKKIFAQLFCTKIGWLVVCLVLALLFGVLSNQFDLFWAEIAMYASLIYPFILFIIMLVYGIIINPIREHREYKKLRDGK